MSTSDIAPIEVTFDLNEDDLVALCALNQRPIAGDARGCRHAFIYTGANSAIVVPARAFASAAQFDAFVQRTHAWRSAAPDIRARCPSCGYDLRRSDRTGCPECGWDRSAPVQAIVPDDQRAKRSQG